MTLSGRLWRFGDDIDTDALAPGQYMKAPLEVLAAHCLETLDPSFAVEAKAGDVVVAGRNFGMGSSREQAAQALLHLGIIAVIAESFAGIFYRNAINLGLPVMIARVPLAVESGHKVSIDIEAAVLCDLTTRRSVALEPLPAFLQALLRDGGLVPHLEKRFRARREAAPT